jgi:hypothetical protein
MPKHEQIFEWIEKDRKEMMMMIPTLAKERFFLFDIFKDEKSAF